MDTRERLTLPGQVAVAWVASASSVRLKTEHLRIMSTKAASRRLSVIATGTFTSGGHDIAVRFVDVQAAHDLVHGIEDRRAVFGEEAASSTESLAGSGGSGCGGLEA